MNTDEHRYCRRVAPTLGEASLKTWRSDFVVFAAELSAAFGHRGAHLCLSVFICGCLSFRQCPTEAAPRSPTCSKREKRVISNGRISSGTRSVAMVSAMRLPHTGVALKPQVPQPASM